MKSTNYHIGLRRVLTGVLLALLMGEAIPAIAADQGKDSQHLQGAWLLDLTVPPNGFLPEQFQLLANFTLDGSVLTTSNLPTLPANVPFPFPIPFPKVREGTGHGEWARTGQGTFIVDLWRPTTCVDIGGCIIPPLINVTEGGFVGWARGKAEMQLNGKTDTSQGVVELQLFAPDRQTPLGPALPGTMTGERLRPQPIGP